MEQTEQTQGQGTSGETAAPTAEVKKMNFDQKDIADNKFVAALSYVGLLFLVPLLVKKESPFSQFHAKQGLVLCIAFFLLSFIPVLGWLVSLVLLVIDIIALVKTLSGQAWEIPLVGDVVKKLNI